MNSGSKLASDMSSVVLLNNNFSSIYDLISLGRQLIVNSKKMFLYFMVSSVFSQCIVSLLAYSLGVPQLYSNVHMTIMSAFTDVIPSISFMYEKFEDRDLNLFRQSILDRRLVIMAFLFFGPITISLAFFNYFVYFKFYAGINLTDLTFKYFNDEVSNEMIQTAQSIGFYSMVTMQVFGNLYSIRTRRLLLIDSMPVNKPYRNWMLVISSFLVYVLVTLCISLSIPTVTKRMPLAFYFIPLGDSIFIFFINELRKYLMNKYYNLDSYLSW